MKKLKLYALTLVAVLLSASAGWCVTFPHTTLTADQVLAQLQAGNAQFVKGRVLHLTAQAQPAVRISAGTIGQGPYAVILDCIDARTSPEIIFDRGLNELMAVRVAGNVIDPHEIGSIEYAVEHVEIPLIMVLGHSKCGAVTSSVQYAWPFLTGGQPVPTAPVPQTITDPGNYINSLVNSLMPPITATYKAGMAQTTVIEESATENVKEVAASLREKSLIIDELIKAGKVKIVGAKYDVVTGVVTMIPLP